MRILRDQNQFNQYGPIILGEIYDACSWIDGLSSPSSQHDEDDYDYGHHLTQLNEAQKLHREGRFESTVEEAERQIHVFYFKKRKMTEPFQIAFRDSKLFVEGGDRSYLSELADLANQLNATLIDDFGKTHKSEKKSLFRKLFR